VFVEILSFKIEGHAGKPKGKHDIAIRPTGQTSGKPKFGKLLSRLSCCSHSNCLVRKVALSCWAVCTTLFENFICPHYLRCYNQI